MLLSKNSTFESVTDYIISKFESYLKPRDIHVYIHAQYLECL
jgi:GTP cyclohydrolase I